MELPDYLSRFLSDWGWLIVAFLVALNEIRYNIHQTESEQKWHERLIENQEETDKFNVMMQLAQLSATQGTSKHLRGIQSWLKVMFASAVAAYFFGKVF